MSIRRTTFFWTVLLLPILGSFMGATTSHAQTYSGWTISDPSGRVDVQTIYREGTYSSRTSMEYFEGFGFEDMTLEEFRAELLRRISLVDTSGESNTPFQYNLEPLIGEATPMLPPPIQISYPFPSNGYAIEDAPGGSMVSYEDWIFSPSMQGPYPVEEIPVIEPNWEIFSALDETFSSSQIIPEPGSLVLVLMAGALAFSKRKTRFQIK